MKVSLLVPVYGVEEFIGKCAHSLFGQTHHDMEFVFVDDATPDKSMAVMLEVLEEYPHRKLQVRIVTNIENMGIAASRNVALDNATGDYILYVDSDDYIDTQAVELLVSKAADENADIVLFDYYDVKADRKYLRRDRANPENKIEYVKSLLYRRASGSVWIKFIRKQLIDDHKLRFIPRMDYGEDYYISPLMAYYSTKTTKLDIPLYYYLHRGDSITSNLTPRKVDDIVHAAELLENFFTSVPDAEIYKPMMNGMKVANKAAILQAGNRETWRYTDTLFDDADYRVAELPASMHLILWLHKHSMWRTMAFYRKAAFIIKRLRLR